MIGRGLTALYLLLTCCFPAGARPALANTPPLPFGAEPPANYVWLPLVFRYDPFTVQPPRIRKLEVSLDATRARWSS